MTITDVFQCGSVEDALVISDIMEDYTTYFQIYMCTFYSNGIILVGCKVGVGCFECRLLQ